MASLERATLRLGHRGPDGHGHWVSTDRTAGLGHTRLSVIDLDHGGQPIANEDQTIYIVVNGEFYEHEQIRCELQKRGHRFRTNSDSEIALHLYEETGVDSLHRLRGEFAFVLWDQRNRLLFAARDRFGIKPLFYSRQNNDLYLASEAKALFTAGVPARWDGESWFQQLFLYQNQDRTLFEGIYQVPPGHYLVAAGSHLHVCRYWDLNYPRKDAASRKRSDEEYVQDLRSALHEAVRIRLRADVPVGSFLSGGLDSSAILGIAQSHSSSPLSAYTVTFEDGEYSEGSIAAETARHVGAEFCPMKAGEQEIAAHLPDAVEHAETLAINGHGVARYLLCRQIQRAGHKVVLTGEGADELFAGYIQARQDALLQNGKDHGMAAMLRPPESEWLSFTERVLGYTPSWIRKLAASRSIFHLLLDREHAGILAQRNPHRLFLSQFDIEGQLRGREPLIQSLYLWTRSILPNYSLFAERLEMAFGIESRLPFLDHRLFEVVREMPGGVLLRGAKEKYVLREAARPYLTSRVYERPKHPFLSPPGAGPLRTLLEDTLRSESLRRIPFFDRPAVMAVLDKLPAMSGQTRSSAEQALQLILCACVLQDRFRLGFRSN